MNTIQNLINRAEAYHGPGSEHYNELAAHLDGQAHPKQGTGLTEHGQRITPRRAIDEPSQPQQPPIKQSVPGPITMHEPTSGVDWIMLAIAVALLAFWGFALQVWGPEILDALREMTS